MSRRVSRLFVVPALVLALFAVATVTYAPPAAAAPGDIYKSVTAQQRRLAELAYYVGPVDGIAGSQTRSAVVAFQKVHGLAPDGVVGPKTRAALANPVKPKLKGGAATRIEVDLTRQVVYLIQNRKLTRIMPASSGNGQTYDSGGRPAKANTPVGDFRIERRIRGVRNAPLGTLYDPLYFYRGYALHGSNSVPPYPASHGCVRLTRKDALWLFDRAPVGTPVSLYGGTHVFRP